MSFNKPRGNITTVLDLVSRDSQDNYFFPLDSTQSWFSNEPYQKSYTTANSISEWPCRGVADWGGRLEFVLGNAKAGDLLRDVIFQFRIGHWYDDNTISKLQKYEYVGVAEDSPSPPWTYINSLGTSIIDYAEIQIGDQTIETLSSEFIRTYYTLYPDINTAFGIGCDGSGDGTNLELSTNTGMFSPLRPWPTERGIYMCVLPFFFTRTRLKETIPILSCADQSIRIIIYLKPFSSCVRIAKSDAVRTSCTDTPLGKTITFDKSGGGTATIHTSDTIPRIQDARIVTVCPLLSEPMRMNYLRKPFEQMYKFVQIFSFDEPLKYIVSKPSSTNNDVIDIQLPLELNHPVQELVWVFQRKAVEVNNEWSNLQPFVASQYKQTRFFPEWLNYASLRINGVLVEQGPGHRFRYDCAQKHLGGLIAWSSYIYGHSFAQFPDDHRPSGTLNMSRSHAVVLNLSVNVPTAIPTVEGFGNIVPNGWSVFVFALYYNWMRFENGIANRIFSN